MADEENPDATVKTVFVLTMITAVLFIGTVFIYIPFPNP